MPRPVPVLVLTAPDYPPPDYHPGDEGPSAGVREPRRPLPRGPGAAEAKTEPEPDLAEIWLERAWSA
jgi:hypothetical protein